MQVLPSVVKERYVDKAAIKEVTVPDSAVLSYARQQGVSNRVALHEYIDQMKQQQLSDTWRSQEDSKIAAAKQIEDCLRQEGWGLVSRTDSSVYFTYGGVTYRADVSVARK